jgi:hypothetical protein
VQGAPAHGYTAPDGVAGRLYFGKKPYASSPRVFFFEQRRYVRNVQCNVADNVLSRHRRPRVWWRSRLQCEERSTCRFSVFTAKNRNAATLDRDGIAVASLKAAL